jgi:RNA polymerase sigma factor (sigma-70 family)
LLIKKLLSVLSEVVNIYSSQLPAQNHRGDPAHAHSELSMLIRDCIAESQSAQKKLYDLYAPAAFGIIKRYMYDNEAAAEELLNDAFYKVLTRLGQYKFNGVFEGWIRRIVVNTATDYLRKNIKDEQLHKEVQPEDAYVPSESVEKISHKELLKVIQTLPDGQRTVFNLFVFENYSHKEIATILNINENNSRWYLNDARKRLREKINFMMK